MKTRDIIDTIYKYYPKNIYLDELESYSNSAEYLNRVEKCKQARFNNTNWTSFKSELNKYISEEFNDSLSDYSVLGSTPCYSASMGFGNPTDKNSWMISILISVITPLWAYRIIDFSQPDTARYDWIYKNEENTVKVLETLISKYFPNYEFISEEQHKVIIPDISTSFESAPTIFEAIFKGDFN